MQMLFKSIFALGLIFGLNANLVYIYFIDRLQLLLNK